MLSVHVSALILLTRFVCETPTIKPKVLRLSYNRGISCQVLLCQVNPNHGQLHNNNLKESQFETCKAVTMDCSTCKASLLGM